MKLSLPLLIIGVTLLVTSQIVPLSSVTLGQDMVISNFQKARDKTIIQQAQISIGQLDGPPNTLKGYVVTGTWKHWKGTHDACSFFGSGCEPVPVYYQTFKGTLTTIDYRIIRWVDPDRDFTQSGWEDPPAEIEVFWVSMAGLPCTEEYTSLDCTEEPWSTWFAKKINDAVARHAEEQTRTQQTEPSTTDTTVVSDPDPDPAVDPNTEEDVDNSRVVDTVTTEDIGSATCQDCSDEETIIQVVDVSPSPMSSILALLPVVGVGLIGVAVAMLVLFRGKV